MENNMKLYISLEHGENKADRILFVDESKVTDYDIVGQLVEGMYFDLLKKSDESIEVEAKRQILNDKSND